MDGWIFALLSGGVVKAELGLMEKGKRRAQVPFIPSRIDIYDRKGKRTETNFRLLPFPRTNFSLLFYNREILMLNLTL